MMYSKIHPHSYLSSEESVLPYMGMAAILFNGAEPFDQNVNMLTSLRQKAPCEI